MLHFSRCGCEAAELLPRTHAFWKKLAELLTTSPPMRAGHATLLHEGSLRREFEHISMDGLLRRCRSIVGQADYRCSKKVRDEAPLDDNQSLCRIVIIRGRTGAVLACECLPGEDAGAIATMIDRLWSEEAKAQVLTVATDAPSEHLLYCFRKGDAKCTISCPGFGTPSNFVGVGQLEEAQ